jgi:hypothetical protein
MVITYGINLFCAAITEYLRDGRVTQAMECLPRKHEAMISNPLVLLEKNA